LSFLLACFVFARFRTLDIMETYSTQIGLLTSALELRASVRQTDPSASSDAPALLFAQAERVLDELVHVDVQRAPDPVSLREARKAHVDALP
jgi:hypothetical protein